MDQLKMEDLNVESDEKQKLLLEQFSTSPLLRRSNFDNSDSDNDGSRDSSVTNARSNSRPTGVPADPWLERNWDKESGPYNSLRQLYSSYFDNIHGAENNKVLIDLLLYQLDCFVSIDALLNRKLLLILVRSISERGDRYLTRREFIRLMFFLSFASKEQIEEALFDIVSEGHDRISIGQLVQMYTYRMQRQLSCKVVNIISECDRSGFGQLDVNDFRQLIVRLQEIERLECTQAQPPIEREREKMDEALLESKDLQSWSWDIAMPHLRMSSQLRSLAQCRSLLDQHPSLGQAMSRLAWDYPEVMSASFVLSAICHCFEPQTSGMINIIDSSNEFSAVVDETGVRRDLKGKNNDANKNENED